MRNFISKTALTSNFFKMSVMFLERVHLIKRKMTRQLRRRQHKRTVLKEYWRLIIDRIQRLQIRN